MQTYWYDVRVTYKGQDWALFSAFAHNANEAALEADRRYSYLWPNMRAYPKRISP